jgi:proteasome accessory factor B
VKLLQLLLDGRGYNANDLAKACGIGRRTIFRDLEALKHAGVPVEFDTDRDRYSIPSTYFLPPTNFTAAEALALIALAGEIGRGGQVPFYEAARSAALKLENSLPVPLQNELNLMTRSIRIHLGAVSDLKGQQAIYQSLVDARAARRVVRIQYSSLTEWETITTKLRPYHLMFSRHSWYVIGRSSVHGEVRTFNLSRVESLTLLSERYKVPHSFRLEQYLGNAWVMIPEDGPDYEVHVRFQPLVARNVAEVMWHPTQRTAFHEDGSMDFYATVSGLSEIAWWILGYGDQAEVIAPTKLRRQIIRRAKNMVAIYE